MIEWVKLFAPPFLYLVTAVLAIFLIWLFRSRLRDLIGVLGIRSLKVAGVEISLSSAEIENAQAKALERNEIDEAEVRDPSQLADFAAAVAPYVSGAAILWVDNNPHGNRDERRAFRLLGITVRNCLSTREALEELCRDDYDLVISDIGRDDISYRCANFTPPVNGDDDGWKTLAALQENFGDEFPLIFYHGAVSHEERRERAELAIERGAIGATTSPSELYIWVLSAIVARMAKRDRNLRGLLVLVPARIRSRIKH